MVNDTLKNEEFGEKNVEVSGRLEQVHSFLVQVVCSAIPHRVASQ